MTLPPRLVRVLAILLLGSWAYAASNSAELNSATGRAFGGIHPALSPDGKWIALSYQGAIAKMPAQGGPLVILTHGEGWDVQPAWSPDGTSIAYINAPNFGFGHLRLLRADDGAPLPVAGEVRAMGRLWFHPDGKRMLGRFSGTGIPNRIAWLELATGKLLPVDGIPESYGARVRGIFAPSHDGRWIVFAEHSDQEGRQQGDDGPHADLWMLPATGGGAERMGRFPARIYDLCWDATNNGVFAVTDLGVAHNDIWHLPLNNPILGGTKLTASTADDDSPTVASSTGTLVFTENSEGPTSLVRRDPRTGERTTASIDGLDFRGPSGRLEIKLTDPSRAGRAIARVSVKRKGGKFHAPPGTTYHMTGGLGFFYCRGSTTFSVPEGEYEIIAFRGSEYRMHRSTIRVKADEPTRAEVPLERWVNAAANGWFSGENHIHANYGYGQWYNTPRTILDFVEGEDLRVANLVVANSDGEAVFDREFFRGSADPVSTPENVVYWNQEFRATLWGHMTLMDLKRLVEPIFTGFKGTTNPWDVPTNADIAKRVRAEQGVVSYTHPASTPDFYRQAYSAKGLPVDAALGRIDTMDVIGKSFEPSMQFWYALLNCGFRIPAAAGTDCFLNRIPLSLPGGSRAYVHLPDAFSYEGWIAGMKAGRSFVTNGPMIEFSVNDSAIGSIVKLTAPGGVRVKGRAWSQFPLDKLELVHNGRVVATGRVAADRLSAEIEQEVELSEGGWIALRGSGTAQRYWPGSSMNVHTNPVYVELKDRPFASRKDAAFFLDWIDRLESDLVNRDRMHTEAEHVRNQLEEARRVYRGLLRQP